MLVCVCACPCVKLCVWFCVCAWSGVPAVARVWLCVCGRAAVCGAAVCVLLFAVAFAVGSGVTISSRLRMPVIDVIAVTAVGDVVHVCGCVCVCGGVCA